LALGTAGSKVEMIVSRLGNWRRQLTSSWEQQTHLGTNRKKDLHRFGVDITDLYTTLAKLVRYGTEMSAEETHWVKRIQSPSRAELMQT
jgi:hypothetical protein